MVDLNNDDDDDEDKLTNHMSPSDRQIINLLRLINKMADSDICMFASSINLSYRSTSGTGLLCLDVC